MLAPLLRIEQLAADLGPGPFAAVLTTSANAARAIAGHARLAELRKVPLYTVGQRSAEAARAVGFAIAHCDEGDAHELIEMVARELAGSALPLLYLAGEDRSADLAKELGVHGLHVRTVVVYRAAPAERLPRESEQAIAASELDGVLHYSRRSADAFLRCADAAGLRERALMLMHFCLSQHVAAPLTEAGATDVRIAARPDEAALLELVGVSSSPAWSEAECGGRPRIPPRCAGLHPGYEGPLIAEACAAL
jgi:uroporphyrinogen-III synthase